MIKLFFTVAIFSLTINLIGLNRQGETWDEIAYFNAGKQYYQNLKYSDFIADHWDANKEHPALGKWLLGAVSIPMYQKNITDYKNGRILAALLSALTVGLTFWVSYLITRSNAAALLASAVTATYPLYVGLSKVYGLDIITAFFFTTAVAAFIRATQDKNDSPWYFWSALAAGAAVATRLSGALVYPILAAVFLFNFWGADFWKRRWWYKYILIFPLVGLVMFVATYPWLWQDFDRHYRLMVGHWGEIKEIFLGSVVKPGSLYFFIYFAVVTPTLTVLFAIIALATGIASWRHARWDFVAWFLIPFVWGFLPVTKQDGMRYLIMTIPALGCLIGFWWSNLRQRRRDLANLIGIVLVVSQLIALVNVYPYPLDYYNAIVGGPGNVYQKRWFQISWWGEGLDKAGVWLNQNADRNASVDLRIAPDHTIGRLRRDIRIYSDADTIIYDYLVVNPGYIWYELIEVPKNYQAVFEEAVGGAPLVQIWQKKL